MRMSNMLLLAALAVSPLAFTDCDKKEETKTVDWLYGSGE